MKKLLFSVFFLSALASAQSQATTVFVSCEAAFLCGARIQTTGLGPTITQERLNFPVGVTHTLNIPDHTTYNISFLGSFSQPYKILRLEGSGQGDDITYYAKLTGTIFQGFACVSTSQGCTPN